MDSGSTLDGALDAARSGMLYPSLILYGGTEQQRREAATTFGRALLCERTATDRPCGECRNCRRVSALASEDGVFHPDFHVLERDQKTVTSVEATRRFLKAAQMAPYEARGQAFVVAAAETLGPEASDTLLKMLEEPPARTPRHFLLLAPSSRDLSATLRSRSMSLFLGAGDALDGDKVGAAASAVAASLARYASTGSALYLTAVAARLQKLADWTDLGAAEPWALAAAAVRQCAAAPEMAPAERRALLELAAALLDGRSLRVRGITPQRILEGMVVRHLGRLAPI